MGESYRGLTIRIGADTSTLQKALRGVNSAIGSTQSELRKVKQALNFDPSGVRAAAEGMQLASNRAAELHQKLNTLRKAEQQLASTDAGKRLSSQLYDAQAAALKAKNEYNDLNAALEKVKRNIASATKGKVDLVNTDPSEIDKVVEGLTKAKGKVGELAREYQRLKSMWSGAAEELDTSKQAAQLQDLRVEIARVESQLSSLEAQTTSFQSAKFGNELKAQMQDAVASMRTADAVVDSLKAELATLDEALEMDPSSLDAARLKMQNLQQQAQAATDRIEAMQRQMAEIAKSVGADKVAADFSQAQSAVQEATAELQRMNTELAQARSKMNQIAEEAASFKLKGNDEEFQRLNSELTEARNKVIQLSEAQQAAQRSFETANAVAEYRSLETQVARTKAEIQQLNTAMQGSASKTGASFSAMTTLGLSFYSTLTPAVQQFGSYAVQSANDIDTQYRNMRKTVQGTEYQFEQLLDDALKFSQSNFTSADTLLSIEAMGGQLGIAVENLDEFAETASHLDIATDLDADEVSQAMGQLSGIMSDLTADKFPSFGDALVRLGNNSPALESAIIDITKRIGSMGSIVGFSTPEILAWSTAVASTGQNSEAAGTAISKTMSDIEQATAEGGEKLQAFADIAGMSADEFKAAWDSDPSSAMQAFVEGLKAIDEAGGSVDTTLSELGINEVRQKQALQGLTQTTDILSDSLKMSQDAWDGVSDEWGKAGDAAREAGAKSEGFSGQLQILKNNAQVLSAEMAGALVPLLETAIDVLQDVTTWFKNLSPEMQNLVVGAVALSGALGPVLTVLAAGGNALSQFKNNLMQGRTAFDQVANSMKNYSVQVTTAADGTKSLSLQQKQMTTSAKLAQGAMTALKGVMSTIGWTAAIVGVTTVATALMDAKAKADQFKQATDGLVEASESMGSAYSTAKESVADAISGNDDYVASVAEVSDMVDKVAEKQAELAESIKSTYDEAGATAGSLDAYKQTIDDLAGRSDLSASEVGELKAAIKAVNDLCGTNYQVVEDFGGAYQIMADGARQAKDEILKLIEVQQLQMLAEASASGYQETLEQQGQAAEAAAQAEKTYQDALENKDARIQQVMKTGISYEEAQRQVNAEIERSRQEALKAEEAYSAYDTTLKNMSDDSTLLQMAIDQGADSMAAAVAKNQLLTQSLKQSSKSTIGFAEDLQAAGVNVEQFSELGDTEIKQLAGAYDGTFSSIQGLLSDFGVSFDEAAAKVRTAVEQIQTDSVWLNQNVSTALMNAMNGTGIGVEGMATALANAGMSLETFRNLSAENLAAIVQNYDGTTQSILLSMQNLVVQAGLAGTQASQNWYTGLESGAQLAVGAVSLMKGYTLEQLQGMVTDFQISGTDAITAFCNALAMGADPAYAAAVALGQATMDGYSTMDLEGKAYQEASGANDMVANADGGSAGAALGDNTSQGYSESLTLDDIAESAVTDANQTILNSGNTGNSAGNALGVGVAQGYQSGIQEVGSVDVVGIMEPPLYAAEGFALTSGQTTGGNFDSGYGASVGNVQGTASSYASATTGMNAYAGSSWGWGNDLGAQFAAGLDAAVSLVSAAATNIANAAASLFQFSAPDKGPWSGAERGGIRSGMHLAMNFAEGITSGTPKVAKASMGIASSVFDYLGHEKEGDIANLGPLHAGLDLFGLNAMLNFADGIEDGEEDVEKASDKIATKVHDFIGHDFRGSRTKDGPLKPGEDLFGEHTSQNYADGIEDGEKDVEKSAEGIAQAVADYIEHSSPKKGPLRGGEWIFGYHTAINYAEGLYAGVGAVSDAAGALAGAVEDELSEGEKWLKDYLAKVEDLFDPDKDWSANALPNIADEIWKAWSKLADGEWVRPLAGNVYDSMKVLESSGYDLDEYKKKIEEFQDELASYDEERREWDSKIAEGLSDSDQKSYNKWLAEYNEWQSEYQTFLDMQSKLTASMGELENWADLYKMKDDVISMTNESERLADALWNAGLSGATFSQEFIDYIADGGPEAVHALEQLTSIGKDSLQEMSDSFRDAALAEREAEINMRSLYVNSLKYTDFSTPESRLLDYREAVLDVREAMYSDKGLSNAFEMTGTYAEGFALDLQSLNMSMEDFKSYYDDFTSQITDGFTLMANSNMTSLEDWESNLKQNTAIAQDWANDLQEVFSQVGYGAETEAFRQAVLEGGYEQWGRVIDDMAQMNAEQMQQVVAQYNQSMMEAQLASVEAFKALAPGEEYVNAIVEGIVTGQPTLEGTMTEMSSAANSAIQGTSGDWYATGTSLAQQIANGIQSQIGSIASAAASAVRAAISAAQSAASSGVSSAVASINSGASTASARSLASAASTLSAIPSMAAKAPRAAQAVRNVTNNSTVTMNFTVNTQPGQTVDVRALAKQINTIQNREMKARGLR